MSREALPEAPDDLDELRRLVDERGNQGPCARHPEREAGAACGSCQTLQCAECEAGASRGLCPACASRESTQALQLGEKLATAFLGLGAPTLALTTLADASTSDLSVAAHVGIVIRVFLLCGLTRWAWLGHEWGRQALLTLLGVTGLMTLQLGAFWRGGTWFALALLLVHPATASYLQRKRSLDPSI
jgi:hypothetical protein